MTYEMKFGSYYSTGRKSVQMPLPLAQRHNIIQLTTFHLSVTSVPACCLLQEQASAEQSLSHLTGVMYWLCNFIANSLFARPGQLIILVWEDRT